MSETRNIDANIFMKKVEPSVAVKEVVNDGGAVPAVDNTPSVTPSDTTVNTTVTPSKNRGDGMTNVIDINNITHIFNKGKDDEYKLFENFNLAIPDIPNQGQLVSIMGASGCGKSRLVRAICGLDDIQSGDIKIYNTPLNEYKQNIPMVFQTYSNYEWYTVLENVMLPMIINGIDKATAKKRALELIDLVDLSAHANKYPAKLSGGQQQRVSIARSLACNSQIIVFDEATGALDIKMKREIQNIILKIFYDYPEDPTILNITHSVEEAAYISNIVYILKPNPCSVHKVINIHYPGEEDHPRGEWVLNTPAYANYVKEINQAMEEVCK